MTGRNSVARVLFLVVLLFFVFGTVFATARTIEIKLGSTAPDNSVWADALKRMANQWSEISDGQIRVRIYFAGFKDEADLIRKMRFNQLQAGIVSGFGLQALYPNALAFSMPFLIQSEEEFNYVLGELGPNMASEIDKTGFKLLSWATAGWVYFYTREPITYPEDLKKMKIASSGTEAEDITNAMKKLGFRPVSVSSNEVLSALAGGMVDAVYATPLMVGAMQWFGVAKHMADMKVAPFLGGILINDRVWRQIPEDIRPELIASAEAIAEELDMGIKELEDQAISEMKRHGLQVNEVPPEAVRQWEQLFEQGRRGSGENIYSQDFMEKIQETIREYHRRQEGDR